MIINLVKQCSNCEGEVLEGKLIGKDKRDQELPTCTICKYQYTPDAFSNLPDYQTKRNL